MLGERVRGYVLAGAGLPTPGRSWMETVPSVALQGGQATRRGTTTVNGTTAIALSIMAPDAQGVHLTLYVDARTCQPLRTATVVDGNRSGPYVVDWMPATPGNVAKAKGDFIPVGVTAKTAPGRPGISIRPRRRGPRSRRRAGRRRQWRGSGGAVRAAGSSPFRMRVIAWSNRGSGCGAPLPPEGRSARAAARCGCWPRAPTCAR
jgi:hypothetical protein